MPKYIRIYCERLLRDITKMRIIKEIIKEIISGI